MSTRAIFAALAAGLLGVTGCDTTDSGSTHTTVYYGTGFYSPWYYYGDCCDDHHHHDGDNIIINPPPGGGDWDRPRPSHPIANAPGRGDGFGGGRPSVSPRPTRSIPSAPRPSPRGGGGRRGR